MSGVKRILICDDHVLLCNGIAEMLRHAKQVYDVHIVNTSEDCKAFVADHKIDVFICDLNIDSKDGFVLIEEIRQYLKDTKIIIFSAYFEDFLIQKAEKMKLAAFLRKESTSEELIEAIESDSTEFYSSKETDKTTNGFAKIDEVFSNKFKLSNQEREIIKWIVKGKSSKEIAEILFISKLTVDTHRRNINRKLEISNSGSLIQFAYENHLFP